MDLEARILALSLSKGTIGTGAGAFELGFWSEGWVKASRLGFGPDSWDLDLKVGFWASRLGLGVQGWDLGLKTGIWASRLEFGPQVWDLSLKAGIWASRLGFRPQDWDLGLKT